MKFKIYVSTFAAKIAYSFVPDRIVSLMICAKNPGLIDLEISLTRPLKPEGSDRKLWILFARSSSRT
jgi:hypothetical protein